MLNENDFEAVLVNFCCYEYGANAEAVQKISTRTLLAGVMPTHTETANFKATPMKKHIWQLTTCLLGDTSQVSSFFLTNKNE